jgi:hypothetical protein
MNPQINNEEVVDQTQLLENFKVEELEERLEMLVLWRF